jgi:hypothetical protein
MKISRKLHLRRPTPELTGELSTSKIKDWLIASPVKKMSCEAYSMPNPVEKLKSLRK